MVALIFRIFVFSSLALSLSAREFTVVVYNVENLFDLDGVALFEDYQQSTSGAPLAYTKEKLLTKLEVIREVLKQADSGSDQIGPDLVLFQEFEADFTPESTVRDFRSFLDEHRSNRIEGMLGDQWKPRYAGLPVEAWLLKGLDDAGMTGYEVLVSPAKDRASGIVHANAVFSRFPIRSAQYHEVERARDILELELDVEGARLFVFVNHWKSGASNPELESIRVQNAEVLRARVDALRTAVPNADILLAGDLNSHYNQNLLFPELRTGINDVLGARGDESFERGDLYNLWFELDREQRYSEVWRGRRGTLMHLIISRGLYDDEGISYQDGSFQVLRIPGLNADALGRPLRWTFAGRGGGASDHFPLIARFKVGAFEQKKPFSLGMDALDYEPRHEFDPAVLNRIPDGAFLGEESGEDLGAMIGKQFLVTAKVLGLRPLVFQVGSKRWPAYAPSPELYRNVKQLRKGEEVELVVTPGIWKGDLQLVVEAMR